MEYKSKTQRKKEAQSLQDVGKELVELSDAQLDAMNLPEELYDAVISAKTIKSRSALRRQMQLIGALMRRCDTVLIQEALHGIQEGRNREASLFKEIERWRDELIAGNADVMDEISRKYPSVEQQSLQQLVKNARMERDRNKPYKAYRALFRYLRKVAETRP